MGQIAALTLTPFFPLDSKAFCPYLHSMDVGMIIEALGGPQALAKALSHSLGSAYRPLSVTSWKKRRRIPAYLVPHLLTIAESAGSKATGVNLSLLARLSGMRKPREAKKPTSAATLADIGAAALAHCSSIEPPGSHLALHIRESAGRTVGNAEY